jgi:hypothetical protein
MFLCCATGIVGGLEAFWLFDRLLRLEHDRYPKEWARDGAPIGFFWVPPGARATKGSLIRGFVALKWMFCTPIWAAQDFNAKHLLFQFRTFYAVFLCAPWIMLLLVLF